LIHNKEYLRGSFKKKNVWLFLNIDLLSKDQPPAAIKPTNIYRHCGLRTKDSGPGQPSTTETGCHATAFAKWNESLAPKPLALSATVAVTKGVLPGSVPRPEKFVWGVETILGCGSAGDYQRWCALGRLDGVLREEGVLRDASKEALHKICHSFSYTQKLHDVAFMRKAVRSHYAGDVSDGFIVTVGRFL